MFNESVIDVSRAEQRTVTTRNNRLAAVFHMNKRIKSLQASLEKDMTDVQYHRARASLEFLTGVRDTTVSNLERQRQLPQREARALRSSHRRNHSIQSTVENDPPRLAMA